MKHQFLLELNATKAVTVGVECNKEPTSRGWPRVCWTDDEFHFGIHHTGLIVQTSPPNTL